VGAAFSCEKHSSAAKIDIAAKRHKKHKNKISGLLISMGYEI
jgi:hypothetical protein